MKYLLRFSYDGNLFHGFQRQKDVKNVQGTLENALMKLLNVNVVIKGSGRTDAGVHAIRQMAHFVYDGKFDKDKLKKLNEILNGEIVVDKFWIVKDDFHARHSVKKKVYKYLVNNGKFNEDYIGYYYQFRYNLDLKKMLRVSKLFLGRHDFRNFVSGNRDDYTSFIYKIKIKKRKDVISFTFEGTGFYRYMVRHLVGALLDVGRGRISEDVIEKLLSDFSYKKTLSVVPGDGLYLENVIY